MHLVTNRKYYVQLSVRKCLYCKNKPRYSKIPVKKLLEIFTIKTVILLNLNKYYIIVITVVVFYYRSIVCLSFDEMCARVSSITAASYNNNRFKIESCQNSSSYFVNLQYIRVQRIKQKRKQESSLLSFSLHVQTYY